MDTHGSRSVSDKPEERLAPRQRPERYFEVAIRYALELGIGLSRIQQMAAETAIHMVLEQEGDHKQRAALRPGVTDRALPIGCKARAGPAK